MSTGAGLGGAKPKRSQRVAERIRSELMELLLRGVVRDPAAAGCYVSSVKVTDDLQQARVYVRLSGRVADASGETVSEVERERAVAALNRAASFIRRELSPRLELKYQPTLTFFWDSSLDNAARVEELLAEIAAEDAGKGGAE